MTRMYMYINRPFVHHFKEKCANPTGKVFQPINQRMKSKLAPKITFDRTRVSISEIHVYNQRQLREKKSTCCLG